MAVIIFESANHALAAEKVLENAGLEIDIVPPPEAPVSGCGLAVELDSGRIEIARTLLDKKHIRYLRIIENNDCC